MSRKSRFSLTYLPVVLVGLLASSVQAQVATLLVNDDAPLGAVGMVTGIDSPQTNGNGGWAVVVNTEDGGGAVERIWGTPDGVTPPASLAVEGIVGIYTTTDLQNTIDIDDAGNVIYRSQISDPPGTQPGIFINDVNFIIEETPITAGPFTGFVWDLISPAHQLTYDGVPFINARVRHPDGLGGEDLYEHLMRGSDFEVLLSCGDTVPGLPEILDFDSSCIESWYHMSGSGLEYITEIQMETGGTALTTTDDNAVVVSGFAYYPDRAIMQENAIVPTSIGGLVGENWDNFDYMDVNDFGEVFVAGDTNATSTSDEFIFFDGQIILREGDVIGAGAISSAVGYADMNEMGDWAAIWTVGGVESLLFNGEVVLQVGDLVDIDGDGLADASDINDFNTTTSVGGGTLAISERDGNGDVAIYMNIDVNNVNGLNNNEGQYRLVVTPAQAAAGDVEVRIDDMLDPLTSIPANVHYRVRVRNRSGTAVGATTVTATIDATLTDVMTSVPSNEVAANQFEVTMSGLGAYETRTFDVFATAPTGGVKNSTATVSAAGDPNAANDSESEETLIGLITDLEVTIADSPDPLNELNGLITYTVSVTNNGPSVAADVDVLMLLDPATTYISSDSVAVHTAGQIDADITGIEGTNGPMASGQTFNFTVVVQATTVGTYSASAEVTTGETDPILGNNSTSEDTEYVLESDLRIFIDDNADPIQSGDQIVYTITVENQGPSAATGVVADIILDPDTTAAIIELPGVPNGANVQANIGPMAVDEEIVFQITVDTSTSNRYLKASASVVGSGVEADTDTSDNAADEVTGVVSSTAGSPKVIISTINGHPTAQVPGLPGREFDTLQQPHSSPNGLHWIMTGNMDGTTSDDEVVIRSVNGVIDIVVQEGVTLDDLAEPFGSEIDEHCSINDNGDFAVTSNNDPNTFDPQSDTEIAIKNIGGTQTTVVRQGGINFDTFAAYYFDIRSPLIQSDGTIWVYTLMGQDGPPPNYDFEITGRHIYDDDAAAGGNIQMQTLPSSAYTLNGMSIGGYLLDSLDRYELSVRSDETQYFIQGVADDSINPLKDVAVLGTTDAAPGSALTVVVEEGVALPGLASPVESIQGGSTQSVNRMMYGGDWFVMGSNVDDSDWVHSNGTVIAATGDPLFPGSTESYSDNGFSSGFFGACGNSLGDYVLATRSSCLDTSARNVLVMNGERIVVRSGDPVDVDQNGAFDDDAFINTFGSYDLFLTDSGNLVFIATLRNSGGSTIGTALLTMNVNCQSPGDVNADGSINGDDAQAFVDCLLAGNPPSSGCACADLNGDGSVDDLDTPLFSALLVNLP